MGTDPDAAVEAALAAGRRPIRVLGYDAPYARLVAAGFQPIRLVAPRLSATAAGVAGDYRDLGVELLTLLRTAEESAISPELEAM